MRNNNKYLEILKNKPFNLNDDKIEWVFSKIENMSDDEKIHQLFIVVAGMDPKQDTTELAKKYQLGGFMYRPMPAEEILNAHEEIQRNSKIPAFLAANTEAGGDGIAVDKGTNVGSNMMIGATNDPKYAYEQGKIVAKEMNAIGGNMSFAPVVDINKDFRSPIANLRSYGDNAEKVAEMGLQNVLGTQEGNVAVTVKHFPGDGVDGRDQHLHPTMNHYSLEEWQNTFGKVYSKSFDNGALATMVGHFFAPNLVKDLGEAKEGDQWIPASFNKTILTTLLREKLGFNGLAMTDATGMAGMTSSVPREEMVPLSIENGNDMFLFVRDLDEDIEFMKKGLEKGILTEERLNEALVRILGTKAAINLDENISFDKENLSNLGTDESIQIAREVRDNAITLVRNENNLFPLKDNIKKVLLVVYNPGGMFNSQEEAEKKLSENIINKFKNEGIEAEYINFRSNPLLGLEFAQTPISIMKEKYDAIIYFASVKPASNLTNLNLNWYAMVGMDAPGLICDIPTAFISLGNPYHLYDVPMIKNFINAYSDDELNMEILFDKIMGRTEFKGVSPVEADVRFPHYK